MPTLVPASVFNTSINPFSLAVTDDKRSFDEINWEEEDELTWHDKPRSEDEDSEVDEGEDKKEMEMDAQVEKEVESSEEEEESDAEVAAEVDDSEDEEGDEDRDGNQGLRYAVDVVVDTPSESDSESDVESNMDSLFYVDQDDAAGSSTYSTPPTSVPTSARCSRSPFLHPEPFPTTMRRSTRILAQATKPATVPVPVSSSRARIPKAPTPHAGSKGKGKAVDRSFLSSPSTSGKKRQASVDSEDDGEYTTDKPVKKRARKAGASAGAKVGGNGGGKRATAISEGTFRRLQTDHPSCPCGVCGEMISDEKKGEISKHMINHLEEVGLPKNALTSGDVMHCMWTQEPCEWKGVGLSFVKHICADHLKIRWRCPAAVIGEVECDWDKGYRRDRVRQHMKQKHPKLLHLLE